MRVEFDSEARIDGILSVLEQRGEASVQELSQHFKVSAVTIRKDLEALERRSLLERYRGGARLQASSEEGSFTDRLRRKVAAKKAIVRKAASLVSNGDAIAIDSSTTSHYLAMELVEHHDLVVVTNSLRTATLLSEESDATVVMLGGTVRRTAYSTIGDLADTLGGRGSLAFAFAGVASVSMQRGLMELSAAEANTKQQIVRAAMQVVAMFDGAKSDAFGLHSFATPSQVSRIISDTSFRGEAERWREIGVTVDLCEVKSQLLGPDFDIVPAHALDTN